MKYLGLDIFSRFCLQKIKDAALELLAVITFGPRNDLSLRPLLHRVPQCDKACAARNYKVASRGTDSPIGLIVSAPSLPMFPPK